MMGREYFKVHIPCVIINVNVPCWRPGGCQLSLPQAPIWLDAEVSATDSTPLHVLQTNNLHQLENCDSWCLINLERTSEIETAPAKPWSS